MNLHNIFAKPVDRNIEGVIKADDLEQLKLEAEEYVITQELEKRLGRFFEEYNNYQDANGAWISGFFGSGKSHLLKMLAFLLDNRTIDGTTMLEMFEPKCGSNALLKGAMRKAVSIPSQSILFNIDQKAVTIATQEVDAVLNVFVKVFNEMQGYYGKQGYVAQFERDLDNRGLYEEFKAVYPEVAGHSWEDGREEIILDSKKGVVAEAYARVSGIDKADAKGIIDKYRADYKLSIGDFAEMVHEYIQKQEPGFRLNFFVDEVGQYIADHVKLMTNLQTIAESLATKCKGQAWVIVTAQEDMDTVMGSMTEQYGNDFSKIMDRFKIRMKLTSANVDEVIRKRLLKKKEDAKPVLGRIYREEKNNFGTLFRFSDDTVHFRLFRDQESFVSNYPFVPYQFTLFQKSLMGLSDHNAFEGRHSSVGERSMLGVFQRVVKEIADEEVGSLATFDLMFEGIRTALKSQTQNSIRVAEQNLDDAFAVRLLKALFLVKYVKEFTASPRNLRVLMQDEFQLDITEREEKIKQALGTLERQTYIQRTGEAYEYLTDEEKDIEEEIKNTQVDESQMVDEIGKIVFDEVIQNRKLRYEPTKQNFPFTRKLDDRNLSREQELTIHLITPFHSNVDNLSVLQGHSMGKDEVMVVMPSDPRLMEDLRMFKKTEKYIRQNSTTTQQEMAQRILHDKSFHNKSRHENIRKRVRDLLREAKIIVSGNEVQVNGSDPLTRIHKGFDYLVQTTYTNLNMVKRVEYKEENISNYLEQAGTGLFGEVDAAYSEAEQEILAYVKRAKREGLRTTLKKIEEQFTTKPYGWSLAAVQCLLAMLCGKGKIELRSDGNLLEDEALKNALRKTRNFSNVIVNPQIDFTAGQLRRLKDFFGDFFDRPPQATDARSLGRDTRDAFRGLLHDLEHQLQQRTVFPFLSALEEPIQKIRSLSQENYAYFLTELSREEDELLEMKETILDPIQRFMSGSNRAIYREASQYLEKQDPNFSYLDSELPGEIKDILRDPACYRGNRMKVVKEKLDRLKDEVSALLEEESSKVRKELQELREQFVAKPNFQKLSENMQLKFEQEFKRALQELEMKYLVPVIRDQFRQFKNDKYNRMLTEMDQWVAQQATPGDGNGGIGEVQVEYITRDQIEVSFPKSHLENEADVESYLKKLKAALLEAVQNGKHVAI